MKLLDKTMKKTKHLEEKQQRLKKEIQTNPKPFLSQPSFKTMAWKASADMFAAIIVGTGGGLWIDHSFHSAHWGLIIGFLLGSVAGLLNVYRGLCKVGYGLGKK